MICASGSDLCACSCSWEGPFLKVVTQSEYVIRGMVKEHLNAGKGGTREDMNVEVLEVLKGNYAGKTIRIKGNYGWLCRPPVTQFPVGTEWILAINGPGSKPGVDGGPAISACGQYWLQVVNSKATGNITDEGNPKSSEEMVLTELRQRLSPRAHVRINGQVRAGESFEQVFGSRFQFRLEPSRSGWTIVIKDGRGTEDIARLSPPFHGVPNPRDIEGWHFRNIDNTGSNDAGEKNVNAPGVAREFIFSPDVGRTIDGPEAKRKPTVEEIERVKDFGTGVLRILDYSILELEPGDRTLLEWMRFEVELFWPGMRQ
jgi:hypothetical protein